MLGTNEIMQFLKGMPDVQAAVTFNRDGDILSSYGFKDVGSTVQLLLFLKTKGTHIGDAMTLSPLRSYTIFLENGRLMFVQAADNFIGVQGSSSLSPHKLVMAFHDLMEKNDLVELTQ